jgi:hypothetical protein
MTDINASIAAIAANHAYGTNSAIPPGYSLVTNAPSAQSNLIEIALHACRD